MAVSDGSFKEGFGMATYTILGEALARRLVATNVMPGRKEDIDSYRSELGGLYSIIAAVEQVVAHHAITGGQIEVGSDCLVGLQWVFTDSGSVWPTEKHHDLISAMCTKIGRSPLQWQWHHIKGHQDDEAENILDK